MEDIDKQSTSGNLGDEEQISASATAQHQALLRALQEFIVPLVQIPVNSTEDSAINRGPFRAEATRLITALKDFVSSIIGSTVRFEAKTVIRVESGADEGIFILEDNGNDVDDIKSEGQVAVLSQKTSPDTGSDPDAIDLDNAPNTNMLIQKEPQHTFHDKVLHALGEHVFNKMPIRLLCVQPRESDLEITLIERGAIYAYLKEKIEEKRQLEGHGYGPRLVERYRGDPILESDAQAIERVIFECAGYAILSHTWLRGCPNEVTYNDWNKGRFDTNDPGYQKLVNFCKIAWKEYELTLAWMDTLCINKDSSSELDESIRSMYAWYERAKLCLVYLAETTVLSEISFDPWFTRGWTLQELLAPNVLKFYNCNWKRLSNNSQNDKQNISIIHHIERATLITDRELRNTRGTSFSRRMQWASSRKVTREEDTAYSLMGIFDVSIATAYGEGATRAFARLLQEILASTRTGTLDLFNWAGKLPYMVQSTTRLLPLSPQSYASRATAHQISSNLADIRPIEPLSITHIGLRIPVVLMPGTSVEDRHSQYTPIGDYTALVEISKIPSSNPLHVVPTTYRLLDTRVSGPDGYANRHRPWAQYTFAVFNIGQTGQGIYLHETCIAILIQCSEKAGQVTTIGNSLRIETKEPVLFELEGKDLHVDEDSEEVCIPANQLANHGMQFISLYL